jgi:hypothetical protein
MSSVAHHRSRASREWFCVDLGRYFYHGSYWRAVAADVIVVSTETRGGQRRCRVFFFCTPTGTGRAANVCIRFAKANALP